jgi:peptidyl-prolyl cis-trans isomerase A (cyclophilin A)
MRIKYLIPIILMLTACSKPVTQNKSEPSDQKIISSEAGGVNMEKLLNPSLCNEQAPDNFKVRFNTTKGDFVVEVKREWSPKGADRFYNLVKNGFYNDAAFFRVIPGFVAQFGINAKPEISAKWQDARISDDPVKLSNIEGTISFATSGPNTRTTQLFINYSDNSRLDSMGFSPFGKVVEGMDMVKKLYAEYGEGEPYGNGPSQSRIQSEGNNYLKTEFPKLDYIIATEIL